MTRKRKTNETIFLGTTPWADSRHDITSGPDADETQMQVEATVYADQLARTFPPPDGASFVVDSRQYGDGVTTYFAAMRLDPSNDEHLDWVRDIGRGCEAWDDDALYELAAAGFPRELSPPAARPGEWDDLDD